MNAEWTTEYPKEPGYYWIRNYRIKYGDHPPGPLVPGPEIVNVDDDLDYITWTGDEVGIYRCHLLSAEWLGPIQPPQDKINTRATALGVFLGADKLDSRNEQGND